MKVGLITTFGERCGIASYAENLIRHTNDENVQYAVISIRQHPRADRQIAAAKDMGCDIMHLNYEPGLFGDWQFHHPGLFNGPTVMTLHTSHEGINYSPFVSMFTKVVVHEDTHETLSGSNRFVKIPHGIPLWDHQEPLGYHEWPGWDVGTCGFPFPWKGFSEVVRACKKLNKTCLVITPESNHADARAMKEHLQCLYDGVSVFTSYIPEQEVMAYFAKCKMTAFAYHGGNFGISGACRLGFGAGVPVLLSTCRQFRDMFAYHDEVQFIDQPPTEDNVADGIVQLLESGKKPRRVLQDMNWVKTAAMYVDLYKELKR